MDDPAPPAPSAPPVKPGAEKGDPAAMRRFGLVAGGGGILAAIAIAMITGREPAQAPLEPSPPAEVAAPAEPIPEPVAQTPPTASAVNEPPAAPAAREPPAAPAAREPLARPQSATPPPSANARPGRPPALCPADENRPIILVAFERSHPMHEAQRLFAEGRRDEARALAGRLLAERRDLRGLCLDRFSIGGAEIHVGAPNGASVTDWVERLSEMDGVERAEAELIAAPF